MSGKKKAFSSQKIIIYIYIRNSNEWHIETLQLHWEDYIGYIRNSNEWHGETL